MKFLQVLLVFLLFTIGVKSQSKLLTKKDLKYNYIFKEKIYVKLNSSLLLAGENLLYEVFCISDRYKKPSTYSKVAYVELIDSNRENVFKHKIRLSKSVGDGSFFIPASLESGTYKLICYTQAMRNEGKNYFYQADVGIINPFKNLDSTKVDITGNTYTINSENIKSSGLEISTASKKYDTRSKVSILIKKPKNLGTAYLNISVRKLDELSMPKVLRPHTYSAAYPKTKNRTFKNEAIDFLPEVKGTLITGKVLDLKTNSFIKDAVLALSVPENNFILKFTKTDSNGDFIFNLETKLLSTGGFIQVLGNDKKNYKIILDKTPPLDYSNLKFNKLKISPNYKKLLEEYNIYNQIENAYKTIKKDVIRKEGENYLTHYKSNNTIETINLNDYKRFPTVKETILEIVPNVWISKKLGNHFFNVRKLNPYQKEEFYPIVLVDGILVQDYEKLVEYKARNIKSISVIRNNFTYNSLNFQGVINFKTFKNNYHNDRNEPHEKYFTLLNPLQEKKYYKQEYTDDSKKNSRLPDYRTQLLWKTGYKLKTSKEFIDFFTSDVTGKYEINIQGFYDSGDPISFSSIISVN